MKKIFKDIGKITDTMGAPKSTHMCKLTEEVGEMAEIVNIELGTKNGSKKNIKEHATEELADIIQITFALANQYGITFEELNTAITVKTSKWVNKYVKKKK